MVSSRYLSGLLCTLTLFLAPFDFLTFFSLGLSSHTIAPSLLLYSLALCTYLSNISCTVLLPYFFFSTHNAKPSSLLYASPFSHTATVFVLSFQNTMVAGGLYIIFLIVSILFLLFYSCYFTKTW